MCYSVLQCVNFARHHSSDIEHNMYSALQYVIMCCSVLQSVAVRCSVLQCVAERCSVLQCADLARHHSSEIEHKKCSVFPNEVRKYGDGP